MSDGRPPARFRDPEGGPWHDFRAVLPGVPETYGALCGEPFQQAVANVRPSSVVAMVESNPSPRCRECYEIERLSDQLRKAYARTSADDEEPS